jgi:hypothetical protein
MRCAHTSDRTHNPNSPKGDPCRPASGVYAGQSGRAGYVGDAAAARSVADLPGFVDGMSKGERNWMTVRPAPRWPPNAAREWVPRPTGRLIGVTCRTTTGPTSTPVSGPVIRLMWNGGVVVPLWDAEGLLPRSQSGDVERWVSATR